MRRATTLAAAALACAAAAHAGPPQPAAAPAAPPAVLVDPNAPPAAPAAAPGPADPAAVARGRGMYKDYCQKCHGVEMVSPGGSFFDLRQFPHDDKARFVASVLNGKRAMPPWNGVLAAADVDSLWAYVTSGGK